MPAPECWFEDFHPGDVAEFGDHEITEAEILAFARTYDPQPFHIDAPAARASIYGGLIASGWNTAAVMMKLLVEHVIPPNASLGSPGVDELRWLRPVRPGDRLRLRQTVEAAVPSRCRPDRGTVRSLTEVLNQAGEIVMTVRGTIFYLRRPPAA